MSPRTSTTTALTPASTIDAASDAHADETQAVAADVSLGLTSSDWVTRQDMAALIRASVDTVVRAVEAHKMPERTETGGTRKLVNVGDFLRAGKLRPQDLTLGNTPAESAEVLRARQTITELKERAAELTGRLGNSDTLVTTLREQLAVKDKQIAKQAEQITALIARLGALGTTGGAA